MAVFTLRREVLLLSSVTILAGIVDGVLAIVAERHEDKMTTAAVLFLLSSLINLICGAAGFFAVFKEHFPTANVLWLVSLINAVLSVVFVFFKPDVFSVVSLLFSVYYTYTLWSFKELLRQGLPLDSDVPYTSHPGSGLLS